MNIDITKIPFTCYGSYLAFSILSETYDHKPGLYLRSVHGPATGGRPMQEILLIELLAAGDSIPFDTSAEAHRLRLSAGNGRQAEACFEAANSIRFRLHGASLRFQMSAGAYDNIISTDKDHWRLTVNTVVETKLGFTAIKGTIEVDAPWDSEHSEHISITLKPDSDQWGEFAADESTVNWLQREH